MSVCEDQLRKLLDGGLEKNAVNQCFNGNASDRKMLTLSKSCCHASNLSRANPAEALVDLL